MRPDELVETHGTDALRWFLARQVGEVSDTDFTVDRLVGRPNDDLASGVGNVTNRIVILLHRYCGGRVRPGAEPISQLALLGTRSRWGHRRLPAS